MPSSLPIQIPLHPVSSAPTTPTFFESTCELPLPVERGPKVLNGRLVKSKPRTSSKSLPPSTPASPSPLKNSQRGGRVNYDDNNHNNENVNGHVNATKEPPKHSKHSNDSHDKEVKPEKSGSGSKIWRLVKRISTGALRDKHALHSSSFSVSGSSSAQGAAGGSGGPPRSLSRTAQLKVTNLSNYSEDSLSFSHQSYGSYGSLVASTSHTSHGEPFSGPAPLAFNTFSHDHAPPPVPVIPKDLQNPQNHHHLQTPNVSLFPSPSSLSFSEPGSNVSRKHHRRDRDTRSASSSIPSIPSPLSPGHSSYSSTNSSSSPPPHTPSPPPSAPSKKRILSRISSMGLLRRKPSIASGLASSLGFSAQAAGTSGMPDKVEKMGNSEKNENKEGAAAQGDLSMQKVPALFPIPAIPSTPPPKLKPAKYSIPCIPVPSIPSIPSTSIIAASTPSTPIKLTTTTENSSFSFSASSRPGTGRTISASSPRLSLDSRSHSRSMGILTMQSGGRSRSRSSSLDSSDSLGRRRNHHNRRDHGNRGYTTPTRSRDHYQDQNNNNNHNTPVHSTTDVTILNDDDDDYPYPLARHIIHPLELSATLSGDNRWGVEHVLSGDDHQGYVRPATSSSSVSLPAVGHINGHNGLPHPHPSLGRRDEVSADPGLGPKRINWSINNRSTGSLLLDDSNVMVNTREEKTIMVDKWERSAERVDKWDKLELDKLDGLRSKGAAVHGEPWAIVRSPEQEEMPSLPVPPRKKMKEKEKEPRWERSKSVDIPASPVSSSPVYRGRAVVDDTPAPSTFGRVMGKKIGAEESMEEKRRSSLSPIQGKASFSVAGDDKRDGSRTRRSLSAVRPASALSSLPKDGQSNVALPSLRPWTSPSRRENAADVATVVPTATSPTPAAAAAAATPPRALGTLFRKLSFSGVSSSPAIVTEKRRNKSTVRPSTASSIPSGKASSGGSKSGFFWNGDNSDNNRQSALASSSSVSLLPQPRKLLRKNNAGNQVKDAVQDKNSTFPVATRIRRPRTADALSSISGTLTEKEKRERWEYLLEKSEKAGGTIHLRANGEGLLSDRMRMSMASTALKGKSNTGIQDKDTIKAPTFPVATRMRRPRTADASSSTSGTLTEKEKRERWEYLLERSEKAGGTIHLRANGEGLLSDRMRMSMVSTALKGKSNTGIQNKDTIKAPTFPMATRMRRPRTADASPSTSGTLTEKEKRERWEYLLERSEKAGGTIHLRANGEGLLSDRMRMSMVSTASGVSGAQVGVQEGDC